MSVKSPQIVRLSQCWVILSHFSLLSGTEKKKKKYDIAARRLMVLLRPTGVWHILFWGRLRLFHITAECRKRETLRMTPGSDVCDRYANLLSFPEYHILQAVILRYTRGILIWHKCRIAPAAAKFVAEI